MSPQETMALLDLDADLAPVAGRADGEAIPGAGGQPPKPPSETVLDLDRWSLRKGQELVEESDELRQVAKLAERLADKAADGTQAPRKPRRRKDLSEDEQYWGKVAADFHAAAYEPHPERTEAEVTDPLRKDFMAALMDTQEFHDVRRSTCLNPLAAEVATLAFAQQFAKRREEDKAERAKGPTPPGQKAPKGLDPEMLTALAAARACRQAQQEVDAAGDAAEMCGHGSGAGGPGSKLDAKRLAALHKRVRGSANLRRIAELAGRFRRLAASKQRQKAGHGLDEVVGVTVGDELARLLPAELARLTDEDFGLETARRLLERETQQFQTRANVPVGRGPIVVTVDESGSMTGDKIETAKALALAMAWIAKKQRRFCVLIGFSGFSKHHPREEQYTRLVLKPAGGWDEQELLDWLEHFFSGGTDMDVPLEHLPTWWPELCAAGMARGKTDIVMITDDELTVPPKMQASFLRFKAEERVRLTTLCIGGSRGGNIGCVADEVYPVPVLDLDAEAVGKVLSV